MTRPKALVSWISGKDSAWALHAVQVQGEVEVVGILTTVTAEFSRVAMHAVREVLLEAQATALGLPCRKVRLPWPCSNEIYAREMAEALQAAKAEGVTYMVLGDLFLQDIRAYREAKLAGTGISPLFPLWQRHTRALAREMIDGGLRAALTCVDPSKLDRTFAGREFAVFWLNTLHCIGITTVLHPTASHPALLTPEDCSLPEGSSPVEGLVQITQDVTQVAPLRRS